MQDNNIYLYFGNNETAAGKIYHRKQAHFFEDQFIDKSATGRFFLCFCYVFRKPAYNSLVNRFFILMILDQFFKICISLILFLSSRHKDKKLFVISNDFVSIYYCLLHKKLLKNKIHLSCHDLPWTFYHNYASQRWISFFYKYIYKKFDSFDFTSPKMEKVLQKKYSFKAPSFFITYSGIDLLLNKANINKYDDSKKKYTLEENTTLNLLYLGSIRFKDELQLLCTHLCNQKIKFNIDCFSSVNPSIKDINYLGFCDNIDKINFKEYDFGIVPMSFSEKDKDLIETSFPGKTSVYLSKGLPLLCISPEYSALNNCIKNFNIGISYNDLNDENEFSFEFEPYRDFIKKNHNYSLLKSHNKEC